MSETLTLSPEEMKTLRDFLNFGQALAGSVSSTQITRLASGLGEMMPLLAELNKPELKNLLNVITESADDLTELIQMVNKYHKSGALKNALDLMTFMGVVKDALGTQTISSLAEKVTGTMVMGDQLASELGTLDTKKLISAAKKASVDADNDSDTIGPLGLLKALKEPQVQKGIKFLLHFSKNIS